MRLFPLELKALTHFPSISHLTLCILKPLDMEGRWEVFSKFWPVLFTYVLLKKYGYTSLFELQNQRDLDSNSVGLWNSIQMLKSRFLTSS